MPRIHSSAFIHPSLHLPSDADVGPYAVVDEDVVLGAGARIGAFCHLYPGVRLEDGVDMADGVVLGGAPQDLKYRGEKTCVQIGAGTVLREYVTVNRGTAAAGTTRIGRGCLIMAYAHVAHDCVIGDKAILANGVNMGGHVRIGEASVISGMTGIHQFTVIGPGVFVGGCLRVDKDIPPFSKALGDPLTWAGVNEIGLVKFGFGEPERRALKKYYRGLSGSESVGLGHSGEGGNFFSQAGAGSEALAGIFHSFFTHRKRDLLTRRVAHPRTVSNPEAA